MVEVGLHRADGENEPVRDLGVRQSVSSQADELSLPGGQPCRHVVETVDLRRLQPVAGRVKEVSSRGRAPRRVFSSLLDEGVRGVCGCLHGIAQGADRFESVRDLEQCRSVTGRECGGMGGIGIDHAGIAVRSEPGEKGGASIWRRPCDQGVVREQRRESRRGMGQALAT